jgi:rubrerythrin
LKQEVEKDASEAMSGNADFNPELTAVEAIEIAERIERNGAKFYRHAAGLSADRRISSLFVELAQWESRHQKVFEEMRERYAARMPADARDGSRADGFDATAMAGLAVFGIQPDPAEELTGRESRTDVLKLAVEKEKDSIVFYSGLKGFLANRRDGKVLEDIIAEEMKHVRILAQSLGESE